MVSTPAARPAIGHLRHLAGSCQVDVIVRAAQVVLSLFDIAVVIEGHADRLGHCARLHLTDDDDRVGFVLLGMLCSQLTHIIDDLICQLFAQLLRNIDSADCFEATDVGSFCLCCLSRFGFRQIDRDDSICCCRTGSGPQCRHHHGGDDFFAQSYVHLRYPRFQ